MSAPLSLKPQTSEFEIEGTTPRARVPMLHNWG